MGKLEILDCTLRDGGYVNDWVFGYDTIKHISNNIASSGIDIFEICFMRDEMYNKNRCVFPDVETMSNVIQKHPNVKYAAMIETGNLLPIQKISEKKNEFIDMIRFVTWKNKTDLAYDYCDKLLEKGYEICIQPTRTDQYSLKEYSELIKTFYNLKPSAFYIVDTFGVLSKDELLEYVKVADQELPDNTAIGYHGHNNFMQVVGNAEAFVEFSTSHNKYIDASLMGIGRGAGNLPLEIFSRYVNNKLNRQVNIDLLIETAQNYIEPIYKQTPWGYNIPYFITASNGANPNYALECTNKGMKNTDLINFLSELSDYEKIRFMESHITNYLNKAKGQ